MKQHLYSISMRHKKSGEYDYMLKIYARNMQDYQNFVLGTLGDLDCIGSLHSIFVIGEVKNTLAVPVKA